MKLPPKQQSYLEANLKLAEQQKKAKDVKIPFEFLTELKGGKHGEQLLRERKKSSAK